MSEILRTFRILRKDTTKNWEREKNGEGTLKQSTLANLTNISAKPLNAIKKPFEARVTLLSRYSFQNGGGVFGRLPTCWITMSWHTLNYGNLEYKNRDYSGAGRMKNRKKTIHGCDCADMLRFAYCLTILHRLILHLKNVAYEQKHFQSIVLPEKIFISNYILI